MKTKKWAGLSGRVGFFVLALLAVAVVGGQINPPPESAVAASTAMSDFSRQASDRAR